MQNGEGRVNIVHLTAAQISNTGASSTASVSAQRLPPMHPTTLSRESTMSATHLPMNMIREPAHITVPLAPNVTTSQPTNVTMSRENGIYNIASPSSTPQTNSTSSSGSSRILPQNNMISPSSREVPVSTRQPPMMEESHRSLASKEASTASVRKRSRMLEESVFIKEGLSRKREEGVKRYHIDIMMQNVQAQVEQALARGDKGKGTTIRLAITESLQELGLEICQLMNCNSNLQEENRTAQKQIIELQNQLLTSSSKTYMGALLQPVSTTNQIPMMHIPAPVRHAPAEKIIIFRAERKGEKLSKEQQNKFRTDVRDILGEQLMSDIEVIRPTRNGGHILIFQTNAGREQALLTFRNNEISMNIPSERSCIMAPNKRYAKVVCRDPPDDTSPDEVMEDFYGKRNGYLNMTMSEQREARITTTRFGWIFELSCHEAAAIQAQGNRIRFGIARELMVEEYIPIQQCYNCCMFGHSAKFCQMEHSYCRLCGIVGHAGWDCPHRENKAEWRCANCIITNETKGTKYPTNHAAAQLHKCPCALSHKNIRKAQLSAEGIFTYPDNDNSRTLDNNDKPWNTDMQQGEPQRPMMKRNNKMRSRSNLQNKAIIGQNNRITSSTVTSQSNIIGSSSTSSASNSNFFMGNSGTQAKQSYLARTMKPQRPRSFDAWKSGGRTNNQYNGIEESRGRDFAYQMHGTNSVTTTQMSDCEIQRPIQMMDPAFDG